MKGLPMSKRAALAALVLFTFAAQPSFGWWETGHRVVARIAALHLTPQARARVASILGVPDSLDAVADALAKVSTWADEVRSSTNTGEWHYIDLTLQDHKADFAKRCEHDNCAPARIRLFAAQLAGGPKVEKWSDLDALRFVVHFVGDIHQPLHAASDADLGGNCELLDPPVDTARNLHALWDGGIVKEISDDDRKLAADLESSIAAGHHARRWSHGDAVSWAWESHRLAVRYIYSQLGVPVEPVLFPKSCKDAPAAIRDFKPVVDAAYTVRMKPVVTDQLSKGGLRLAALLNRTLGQ
jgi:hypothetical protein